MQQGAEEVTPAPHLKQRREVEETQSGVTLNDIMEVLREQKGERKRRRKHRRRRASPTPEVERREKKDRKKDPPSEDEDAGPKVFRGPQGSLIFRVPASMVR